MKKTNLLYALGVALALGSTISTIAQDAKEFYGRPSYWRPYDQRGINVFETTKTPDSIPFEGPRIRLGAGFTQQFQGLEHKNNAVSNTGKGHNTLYALTPGFNTASANLNIDVQLSEGIRLNVVSYLSSRHHNETWVKGGYIQFDRLPFKGAFWNQLMDVATIKVGHMEINYGDAHFRRTDGGQSLYNPFAENYILDAFTTEIGGEITLQKNGLFGVAALTNGMVKGNIEELVPTAADDNTKKSPALYFKGGFDKQLTEKVRVRAAASLYHNGSSGGNTLYAGDRTGSHYFMVLDPAVTVAKNAKGGYDTTKTAASSQFTSGRLNPGFSKKVDAVQLNGFLKAGGLELFGTYEVAKGRTKTEADTRKVNQLAGDVVYRFGNAENLFVGARYNTVKAELAGIADDVTINRTAVAGGWFLTKNVLLKGEYVIQKYKDFPTTDVRSGGKFNGYVIEAVVGF